MSRGGVLTTLHRPLWHAGDRVTSTHRKLISQKGALPYFLAAKTGLDPVQSSQFEWACLILGTILDRPFFDAALSGDLILRIVPI